MLWWLLLCISLIQGCAPSERSRKANKSITGDGKFIESFDSATWDLGPSEKLGKSLPGIWSSLTEAEIATLSHFEKAKSGHSDALLRLFILAAGTQREVADMARYQGQIQKFCDSLAPFMTPKKPKKEKARALLKSMYRHFIQSKGDNPIYGYDYDYSDLTRLLDERIYNCVSITMLYLVLGAHFQLDMEPVLMPGHVFVQLRLESGEIIEIETVSRTGFAVKHDKAFFREQANLLGSSYGRNLTYENYQSRRIIQPWQLALENMRNQHTMPSVIGVQGYFRLRELQSILQPADSAYRKERLNLYFEAVRQSKADSNFSDIVRLCRVAKGFLDSVHAAADTDTSLRTFYAHLRWHQAEAQIRQGENDTSWYAALDAATHTMRHDTADSKHIFSNSLALLEMRWIQQVEKHRFKTVEKEINRFERLCPSSDLPKAAGRPKNEAPCAANREWFYQNWAAWHWNTEAWELAIRKLEMAYRYSQTHQKIIKESIGLAYCNWSNDFVKKQDYQGSLRILKACLEKSPDPKPCRERIAELKKHGVI